MIEVFTVSSIVFALSQAIQIAVFHFNPNINRASFASKFNKRACLLCPILIYWKSLIGVDMAYLLSAPLLGILIYACLYVLYMPFYYTISHSLSVRTLRRLSQADSNTFNLDAIKEPFTSKDFVTQRLDGMSKNGFLICEKKEYKLRLKGKIIAYFFLAVKKLWRLGAGG
jgi:hypothetical protein